MLDFVVDVIGFMEKKLEVVFVYKSQFYDENSNELEIFIFLKNIMDSLSYRNQNLGCFIGIEYVEGFIVE